MRGRGRESLAAAVLAAFGVAEARGLAGPVSSASTSAFIAEADAHYARRDAGHAGGRAGSLEIFEAVAGYERAATDRESAEARWKLARALYFLGTYTGLAGAAQVAIFERARRFGDEAIAIVARRRSPKSRPRALAPDAAAALSAGDPDAAPSYFWTAVAWGQWSLASGRFEAARTGAAQRIRDDCLTLIRIDPAFEEGGGYRILGRLHDQAPRIPLLTGWVSRAEALRFLRLAVEAAPRNMVNRHFLAEALAHRGGRDEREEGIRLEEQIVADQPAADHLVEELALQETARTNLIEWKK